MDSYFESISWLRRSLKGGLSFATSPDQAMLARFNASFLEAESQPKHRLWTVTLRTRSIVNLPVMHSIIENNGPS